MHHELELIKELEVVGSKDATSKTQKVDGMDQTVSQSKSRFDTETVEVLKAAVNNMILIQIIAPSSKAKVFAHRPQL